MVAADVSQYFVDVGFVCHWVLMGEDVAKYFNAANDKDIPTNDDGVSLPAHSVFEVMPL